MRYFTDNPLERMMMQIPRQERGPDPSRPAKGHPCHGCKRYGEGCILPCRPSRRKRSMTLPRRSTMKAIRSIWKIRNTRSRSCGRIRYSFFLPAWLTPSSGPRAGNGLSSF